MKKLLSGILISAIALSATAFASEPAKVIDVSQFTEPIDITSLLSNMPSTMDFDSFGNIILSDKSYLVDSEEGMVLQEVVAINPVMVAALSWLYTPQVSVSHYFKNSSGKLVGTESYTISFKYTHNPDTGEPHGTDCRVEYAEGYPVEYKGPTASGYSWGRNAHTERYNQVETLGGARYTERTESYLLITPSGSEYGGSITIKGTCLGKTTKSPSSSPTTPV